MPGITDQSTVRVDEITACIRDVFFHSVLQKERVTARNALNLAERLKWSKTTHTFSLWRDRARKLYNKLMLPENRSFWV